MQPRQIRGAAVDFLYPFDVADGILRHRPRPPRNRLMNGKRRQAENAAQLAARDLDDGFVGLCENRLVSDAPEEASEDDFAVRRAARKFRSDECPRREPRSEE